jgi:hypothetical protein
MRNSRLITAYRGKLKMSIGSETPSTAETKLDE